MKGIYIFLADGFEDIEALATNDIPQSRLCYELIGVGRTIRIFLPKVTISVDDCLPFLADTDHMARRERCSHLPVACPGQKLGENKVLIKLMQDHYDAGGT